MRYQRISHASIVIAVVLLSVAVGAALTRSAGRRVPSQPTAFAEGHGPASEDPAVDLAMGRRVFDEECASCHQDGKARGRAIPALHGLAVERYLAEGGRSALIDLFLRGTVGGEDDAHPDYPYLSDEAVAATIHHTLVSWGNEALLPADAEPIRASDVRARR